MRRLIIETATSNPTWGYRRLNGEPAGLAHRVGASTVGRILKQHRIDPAPRRTSLTWAHFLRSQAGRNLLVRHPYRFTRTRALIRDHASQFVNDFDEIFRTEGLKILRTPVRVPVANAFAERWIATLRGELLDRIIIWNPRQLQPFVIDYVDHYTHRFHRSLDQRPHRHTTPDHNTTDHPLTLRLVRTTRCDGPINEYKHTA